MRLKIILSTVLMSVFAMGVHAQQIFKISNFTQHNFLYNPAASGANDRASVGMVYRSMWSGIAGGPKTEIIYGDKYFAAKKVGVSAVIYNDVTGPTSRSGGNVNLSYSVDFENGQRLMFGLGGQVLQFRVDKAQITDALSSNGIDPLLAGSGTTVKGDADAGVYYKSNKLNVGISAMQLIQTKLDLIKGTSGTDNQGKLYRHYFLMADYNWQVDDADVLVPNILIKYLPNSPTEFEGGVRLEHQKLIWVGFNYHYKQDVTGYIGINATKDLSIGYSFDHYNQPLNTFDGGNNAHELFLRYFFGK